MYLSDWSRGWENRFYSIGVFEVFGGRRTIYEAAAGVEVKQSFNFGCAADYPRPRPRAK